METFNSRLEEASYTDEQYEPTTESMTPFGGESAEERMSSVDESVQVAAGTRKRVFCYKDGKTTVRYEEVNK